MILVQSNRNVIKVLFALLIPIGYQRGNVDAEVNGPEK